MSMASPQKQAIQLRLLNELSTKLQSLLESEDFYQEIVNMIQSTLQLLLHPYLERGARTTSYTLRAQAGAYRNHLKIGHTLPTSEGIMRHRHPHPQELPLQRRFDATPTTPTSRSRSTPSPSSACPSSRTRRSRRHPQCRERPEGRV